MRWIAPIGADWVGAARPKAAPCSGLLFGARMSLTPSERNALRWLVAVAAAGAAVQVVQQWRHSGAVSPIAAEALSRQLMAVDSAQRAGRSGRPLRSTRGSRSRGSPQARPDSEPKRPHGLGQRRRRPSRPDTASPFAREVPTLEPVDLDRADAVALERLPRIGPALAARIVDDRRLSGAFGSLEALQRVRGIGPKLAASLRGRVTFSGNPRPSPVQR